MNEKTAKQLEYLRKQHGLSQRQLAEKIGVSRDTVSKWENGQKSPDTDHLVALSNLYRISVDEIINPKSDIIMDTEKENERAEYFGYTDKKEEKQKSLRANNFPFPVIAVIIYMVLGFFYDLWHPGWLIFLTIPIYYFIVSLFDKNQTREDRIGWLMAPYSIAMVAIYFILGFFYNLWHPAWLIFLTIPIFYFLVNQLTPLKEGESRKFWLSFPYPLFVVGIFFLLGYFYNLWHPGWIIFMTIPLYYYFADRYYNKNEEGKKSFKTFPYPLIVAGVYLILGFVFNLWHPGWLIFLTIPIWAFFFDKNKHKNNEDK